MVHKKAWRIIPSDYGWRDDEVEWIVHAETRGKAAVILANKNDMPLADVCPYRYPAADDIELTDRMRIYLNLCGGVDCPVCGRRVFAIDSTFLSFRDTRPTSYSLAVVGLHGEVYCSPDCAGTDHEPWEELDE